jgi:hypothetical protein
MKTRRRRTYLNLVAAVVTGLWMMASVTTAVAQGNPNPGVLPINSKPFGKTYSEWAAEWWKWAVGIPAAENPLLDPTGEFGGIAQSGKVWFLAGAFGGTVERTVVIPTGKALFFPLLNSLWWAPDDLERAAFVAEKYFGLDPAELTDEELIRLVANFQIDPDASLILTIDGVPLRDLASYRADSPGFLIEDTDLLDDLGVPIAEENLAVAAGYWIMLTPLPPGSHEIRFTAQVDNPEFGPFTLDVTYHVIVKPGKK